jgi:hypothetical protein
MVRTYTTITTQTGVSFDYAGLHPETPTHPKPPKKRGRGCHVCRNPNATRDRDGYCVFCRAKGTLVQIAKVPKRNISKQRSHWTPGDDEKLRKWCNKKSLEWIASKLKRTTEGIRKRTSKLGLLHPNVRWWTDEEIEYLRENYPGKSIREIADVLGRNKTNVFGKLKSMGMAGQGDTEYVAPE